MRENTSNNSFYFRLSTLCRIWFGFICMKINAAIQCTADSLPFPYFGFLYLFAFLQSDKEKCELFQVIGETA